MVTTVLNFNTVAIIGFMMVKKNSVAIDEELTREQKPKNVNE
jgi:large-conductance mechanosensitive channel